jgi:hypothetical protein
MCSRKFTYYSHVFQEVSKLSIDDQLIDERLQTRVLQMMVTAMANPACESIFTSMTEGETKWRKNFISLALFKVISGHCNVPSSHKKDKALANWVGNVRAHWKKYPVGSPRYIALETLGFRWSTARK